MSLPVSRYSTNGVSSSNTIKVTTYNVLSSHLSEEDYFTHCDPKHLHPPTRLRELQKKLDVECAEGSIICLQEVSNVWAGSLVAYFASKKYVFTTGLYGSKFNGYMGVGIAVPMEKYNILDVNVVRVADTKRTVKIRKDDLGVPRLWLNYFTRVLWQPLMDLLMRVGLLSRPTEDPWDLALRRFNQMVCVKLAPLHDSSGDDAFVVGTYHMPCMFRTPSVMTIHCALSAQHIARYSRGLPFVYCGDFNIKPGTPMYELFAKGRLPDETSPESPVPFMKEHDGWRPVLEEPLVSAYAVANIAQGGRSDEYDDARGEPDFTNHARIKDEEPFVDTLDYIWLGNGRSKEARERDSGYDGPAWKRGWTSDSDEDIPSVTSDLRLWQLQSVLPLPHRDDVVGPYPAFQEPSDHILLSANLELVRGGRVGAL